MNAACVLVVSVHVSWTANTKCVEYDRRERGSQRQTLQNKSAHIRREEKWEIETEREKKTHCESSEACKQECCGSMCLMHD